ncbi:electron carrier/ protein disulfide oxidoreductase [Anaeramoeba flamelloides]|uniref:Electron carrier/ protein disulfide oxidoreductase n=1 Tax=Anaeramoeba flamelloides TaxID=1746091 RepID=A0ABQ8XFZ3_9EUKA|nr:electron carrier/ protein disulfide oxidoreductase [Anaeramoeba flamelloides]
MYLLSPRESKKITFPRFKLIHKKTKRRTSSVGSRKDVSKGNKILIEFLESQVEQLKIKKKHLKNQQTSFSSNQKHYLLEQKIKKQNKEQKQLVNSLLGLSGKNSTKPHFEKSTIELLKLFTLKDQQNGRKGKGNQEEEEKKATTKNLKSLPLRQTIRKLEREINNLKNSTKNKRKKEHRLKSKQEKLKKMVNEINLNLFELQHLKETLKSEQQIQQELEEKKFNNNETQEKYLIQKKAIANLKNNLKTIKLEIKRAKFCLQKHNENSNFRDLQSKLARIKFNKKVQNKSKFDLKMEIEQLKDLIGISDEHKENDLKGSELEKKKIQNNHKEAKNMNKFPKKNPMNSSKLKFSNLRLNIKPISGIMISKPMSARLPNNMNNFDQPLQTINSKYKSKNGNSSYFRNTVDEKDENKNGNQKKKEQKFWFEREEKSSQRIDKEKSSETDNSSDWEEISEEQYFQLVCSTPKNRKKINQKKKPKKKPKKKQNNNCIRKKSFRIQLLEELLSLPIGIAFFTEYLKENLNQENILFFQQVKTFKQNCRTLKQIQKEAKKITEKYIQPESLFEINIKWENRKQIMDKIKQKEFNLNLFNTAQNVVFDHMNYNSFSFFKKSKYYSQLLDLIEKDSALEMNLNKKKCVLFYKKNESIALNEEYFIEVAPTADSLKLGEQLLIAIIDLFQTYYQVSTKKINLKQISRSIPFRRFIKLTLRLQNINLKNLTTNQRLCFFTNIYNTLTLHSFIINGVPKDKTSIEKFMKKSIYLINQRYWSLNDIYHGVLRGNVEKKGLNNYFKYNELKKSKFSIRSSDPRIHFALINLHLSHSVRVISPKNMNSTLSTLTKKVLKHSVKIKHKTVSVPKWFATYERDFGGSEHLLSWLSINLGKYFSPKKYVSYSIKFTSLKQNHKKINLQFDNTLLSLFK